MQELRIARSKAGMTLMQLEAASGVGASTISKIERGVTRPQATTLHKLAGALDVEISDLFGETHPLGQAPPETRDYGAILEEMGFPREQIESWQAQEKRSNEAIARALEQMSAKDLLELRMSGNPQLRRYYRDNTPRKDAPPRSESA